MEQSDEYTVSSTGGLAVHASLPVCDFACVLCVMCVCLVPCCFWFIRMLSASVVESETVNVTGQGLHRVSTFGCMLFFK